MPMIALRDQERIQLVHTSGRKIEADGATLHIEERGTPKGLEILFLHGGAGTLDDWDCIIEQFDDCRCILLDSRGHGASSLGSQALNYPLLVRDAELVIRKMEMASPVVIGHSDGGITGIKLAAGNAVPLKGLVTIAAHGDVPRSDIMRNIYEPLTAAKWKARFPEMVAHYERLNPEPDFDRLFAALAAMWRNAEPGNYPDASAASIKCPALIIGRDKDHLVPREETEALAGAIKSANLGIIPFGSHVPHWDHPDRVTPYIREFIKSLRDG